MNTFTKCPRCEGRGIVKIKPQEGVDLPFQLDICEFCHGEGKVDWVQRIVGKGSLSWEQKYDIWRKLDKLTDWVPCVGRKKKK